MDRVAPATQRMRAGRLAVRSCRVLLIEGASTWRHCILSVTINWVASRSLAMTGGGCVIALVIRNDGVGDCPTGFVALNG